MAMEGPWPYGGHGGVMAVCGSWRGHSGVMRVVAGPWPQLQAFKSD